MNIKFKGFMLGMLFLLNYGIIICCADGVRYKEAKDIVAAGAGTTIVIMLFILGIFYV